jgi:hypothetical protein
MGLGMGQNENAWAVVVIGGAWLVAQGAWTLLGYLRGHPKHQSREMVRP